MLSHFFGEVSHGLRAFSFGWVGVDIFFVLSGYLVGRLIIDKKVSNNFYTVFYVRRALRTLPSYFMVLIATVILLQTLGRHVDWIDSLGDPVPLWSYFAMAQNFFMAARSSMGLHWISPTWTLALEEQFYLIVPALLIFLPKRAILPVLVLGCLSAVVLRACVFFGGTTNPYMGLVLLPSRTDIIFGGVVLAVLLNRNMVDWPKWQTALRVSPVALLGLMFAALACDGFEAGPAFMVFGSFLMSVGSALYILMLVKDAPEAQRFRSPFLIFFGRISYALYLTHLAVLGLMHGVVFGATPDIVTVPQIALTLAALPVSVFAGWAITKFFEEPITTYGRTWKWGPAKPV